MRRYQSMTAPAEAAARLRLQPDVAGRGAPPGPGDFATGLRKRPDDDGVCGDFATGMCVPMAGVRATGDFASGLRCHAGEPAAGDFATGMRAETAESPPPGAADRSRPDRERREVRRPAA
jgi:hypothetical protein